jgi:signal transduction histidine kinase
VAHNIKTPLTAIVSASYVLDLDYAAAGDGEASELLSMITASSLKISSIVDALLLLASTTSARSVPLDPLDMDVVVQDISQRLRSLIERYGARIAFPEQWPTALGYGPWVEEVWVNYLSNAIIYSGPNPLITLGADSAADGSVRFWVRDQGPGLSQTQQAQLFTPFTRLHLDRAPGHGLGLSIVQRIVSRLGGRVGVESAPGAGSTFYFTLPSYHAPQDAAFAQS